jgi:hypothetical protein
MRHIQEEKNEEKKRMRAKETSQGIRSFLKEINSASQMWHPIWRVYTTRSMYPGGKKKRKMEITLGPRRSRAA